MRHPYVTSATLLLLAVGAAACTGSTQRGGQPGTADSAAAPYNSNAASGSTLGSQQRSGYFPEAGAPLVPQNDTSANPDATLRRQQRSGYFPEADAPLVPRNTTQPP